VICSGRDVRANDYADLVGCIENAWFDPLCIYSHGERSERRGVADRTGRTSVQGCKRQTPRPARRRVGMTPTIVGRNGDRRVDLVDLGTYLADADTSGVPRGAGAAPQITVNSVVSGGDNRRI